MEEALVFLLFLGTLFGIIYLYFSTRHRERMALIEKGESADLFVTTRRKSAIPMYAVILINLGMLAIGVGLGVLVGQALTIAGLDNEVAFPGSVFLCLGLALLAGFGITRSVDRKYREEEE